MTRCTNCSRSHSRRSPYCGDTCQQAARNKRQQARRHYQPPAPARAHCADCETEFSLIPGNEHSECDWYQLGPAVRACRHCGQPVTADNTDPYCGDPCFIASVAPDLGLDPAETTVDDIIGHPRYGSIVIEERDSSAIYADGENSWNTPDRRRDQELFKPTRPKLKILGDGTDVPPPPGFTSWDDV